MLMSNQLLVHMGSPYSHHHSSNLHSSKISTPQTTKTTTINPHLNSLMASQQDVQPIEPNFQFHFTKLTHTLLIPQHTLGLLLIVIIFSIIFLSACFYFYYRFISHFTHFSSTNNPTATPTTNLTSSSPVPVVSQPLGLDPAAISNLPIFLHRPQAIPDIENGSCGSVFRENECSICLGLFEDEEIIKVLPKCQHAYHSECVDKWLSARSSCPLCRASLLDS